MVWIEMRVREVIAPVLVVLVVAVGTVVPALAVGAGPHAQTANGTAANTTGVQLTAYMQSTAAETNASVETGMWVAAIENSANPDNKIRQRADSLDARLDQLRDRSESLNRSRANGTLPPVVYNAQAAMVHAEIVGLQEAINETSETAGRYGVNVTTLERLRTEAANLTGPEVAAIARNLTTHGPPPWAGNRSAGPGNDTGPPEDPGNGTGPPEDAGNGTQGDNGKPEDPGNGSQAGGSGNGNSGGGDGGTNTGGGNQGGGNQGGGDGSTNPGDGNQGGGNQGGDGGQFLFERTYSF